MARVTDPAGWRGQEVKANPRSAIPVRRPSAWPASDSSAPKISQPNNVGLISRIAPEAPASIAAVGVTHFTALFLNLVLRHYRYSAAVEASRLFAVVTRQVSAGKLGI